jgi:predicted Zn finger-like uncharacterized protein
VKISCPACAAKYSIADEKVSDRLAKIRCRKCNATIVIDGKASPPSVYTAAGEATTEASDDAGDSQAKGLEFTVDFGEGDQRTMTVSEIVSAYNAGQITQDTYLWADGFADWKPLSEVEEVVAALGGGAAPAAAPAAAPWASAAASPARAAARAAARNAPAPDLFGGIDAAGGEDDVATSAPDHSSSAGGRGASSGGGLGLGASSSGGSGPGTGARNESSVLFSLSALTSAASRPSSRPVAMAAPSGAATREDSGLIDLKALTAAATKSEAAAPVIPTAPLISPLAASPLGIASPLGAGSGLGAQAADFGGSPAKSKNGLYIGGGIAVAAIAAVAIAFIMRPPPPAPAPAPVAPPPAAVAPAPTPTAAPTPEVTATPPSTGTAEAGDAPKPGTAKAAPGGVVKRPIGGSTAKKPPAGESKPAVEDKPAAPKPKKNPCGCAPGDLQCAMRCAAG